MRNGLSDEIRSAMVLMYIAVISDWWFYVVNSGFGAANHSMNFVIYVLSGSSFRRELILMLCGERKKRSENTDVTCSTQISLDKISTGTEPKTF